MRPSFQRHGIGAALIEEAHKRAAELNYETVLVLGHKDYYPRFGYKKAEDFGITFPFEVPPEFCMVKELTPGAASRAAGQVKYPKAFFRILSSFLCFKRTFTPDYCISAAMRLTCFEGDSPNRFLNSRLK